MPPDICPNCGAEVPQGTQACPECGSDERTGWSEQARSDNLNLPDEHFDYDDFVQREFEGRRIIPRGIHWFWWIIAILVTASLVYLWRH